MRPTVRPSDLEWLKRQAKDLLRAFLAAEPDALRRVAIKLPRFAQPSRASRPTRAFRLADALCVLAREHGHASWPQLIGALANAPNPTQIAIVPGSNLAPAESPGEARARRLLALAAAVAELAARGDGPSLAVRLIVPRRDLLAVRAMLVERGVYADVVAALLSGLASASAPVRHDCAHALDHFADDRCAAPLRRLLDDPVPRVRRVALHVLSCDACKLTPLRPEEDILPLVIDRALTDPSIAVRRHATSALGGFAADPRAGSVLRALLTTSTDAAIRREARWALQRAAPLPSAPYGEPPL
ncbi:MAG TPA: HEAT repeat domain-containing protein [Ktedonobacterales bacterium]